jgi:arylsulfatase A-like enzyme
MKSSIITAIILIQTSVIALLAAGSKPNILFIFTDDQRADTIHALGNPVIQTPNIDRLASSGLSFNRAYMQGGLNPATCVPSRAMLLSGRNLFHADSTLMRDESCPEAFARAGYTTFISGKWHNGVPSLAKTFQNARSVFVGGMTNPMKAKLCDLIDGKLTTPELTPKHSCEAFTDEAVRFLTDYKNDEPFFCYLPFDGPHDPHIVPPDFPIHYEIAQIPTPPNFLPVHPWDNSEMTIRDEKLLPWPRTELAVRGMLADYYRYITFLDMQIGRVLDTLAASPYANNTIIVFSSDSGVARGSHGLIGKQNVYEYDSVRVPLILSGPGIPKGKTTNSMCYLFDVLPTLASFCGVKPPALCDGIDFSSTLRDPSQPARSTLVFSYQNKQLGVRDARWKLIRYPEVNKTQLFDLKNDPYEITNLAENPEYLEKGKELMSLLKTELIDSGAKVSLTSDNPKTADWTPPQKQ